MHDASLNAARRREDLSELADHGHVDLLVIGGGVTGTGIALDAASRGLRVALVEKHDLAFGTSRFSSKLAHGGLRYLASGNVAIARESAVERGILLDHTAPHLVQPFPQVVPLLPAVSARQAALVRAGLLAGDALRLSAGTRSARLPRSRRVSAARTVRMTPGIPRRNLRGGLVGWDCALTDDARLVVAIARTAAAYGARIITRCSAQRVTGDSGTLHDHMTGRNLEVSADAVVNATGVWAGDLAPEMNLRPSRGTHLVVAESSLGGLGAGLMVPIPGTTNRFVFALPANDGRAHVGLTDEEAPGEIPDVATAERHEIDFLLNTINSALRTPISNEDVLGTFSGLRPLLASDDGSPSADVSRDHTVHTDAAGVISVVGGKLTTYRRMAEDAVDTATHRARIDAGPCRTRRLPLVGAAPPSELAQVDAPRRLVDRYGREATAVIAEAERGEMDPVAEGISTTRAELRFALRHEGALDESDLLDRRTRIGLVPADRARAMIAVREALSSVSE